MKTSLQAIVALALFALLFAAYGVWYAQVSNESAVAAGLTQDIQTKKQTAERASAIQSTLDTLQDDEGAIESYFISEGNVVTFLSELEAVGLDTHSQVKVISIGAPPKAQTRQVLAVSLTITGSFTSVLQAIGAIEYAPYDITTTSAQLTKSQVENGDVWTANMNFVVGSTAKVNSTTASSTQKTTP